MIELVSKMEAVLSEYESGHVKGLLQSPRWTEIRQEVKELSTELELKGQPGSAGRVDREYSLLAEALRNAAGKDQPPRIKEDLILHDISQEFLLTLRSLIRFKEEIDRQYRRRQVEAQKTSDTKGLSRRAEAAWKDYQDAIGKGRFDHSPPTDREAWEWLLSHRRNGEDLPQFETWQRYLREARSFYGFQKNTPRVDRTFGSSIRRQGE